jgi:hypothetical protein
MRKPQITRNEGLLKSPGAARKYFNQIEIAVIAICLIGVHRFRRISWPVKTTQAIERESISLLGAALSLQGFGV